jgi:hypothetical protein
MTADRNGVGPLAAESCGPQRNLIRAEALKVKAKGPRHVKMTAVCDSCCPLRNERLRAAKS